MIDVDDVNNQLVFVDFIDNPIGPDVVGVRPLILPFEFLAQVRILGNGLENRLNFLSLFFGNFRQMIFDPRVESQLILFHFPSFTCPTAFLSL